MNDQLQTASDIFVCDGDIMQMHTIHKSNYAIGSQPLFWGPHTAPKQPLCGS